MADITKTVAPKTDQLNADDFIGSGSRTIKITGVKEMGSKEQPIAISYEGDNGKPWKPCLGMRRILIEIWGEDAAREANKYYPGRSVTLFRDPDVKYGGVTVGGIRVSHASDLSGEKKFALTVAKARRVEFIVKPLRNAPAPKQQQSAPPSQQEQAPPPPVADPAPETSTRPAHVQTAQAIVRQIRETTTAAELDHVMTVKCKGDLGIVEIASIETLKWIEEQEAAHRKTLTEKIPS